MGRDRLGVSPILPAPVLRKGQSGSKCLPQTFESPHACIPERQPGSRACCHKNEASSLSTLGKMLLLGMDWPDVLERALRSSLCSGSIWQFFSLWVSVHSCVKWKGMKA